jgi:anti-sigma factor RsiW
MFARLSEYLDGELDPASCSGIEAHMDDCPPCKAFLESLRRTVDLARDLPEHELPEEFTRELVEAYRKAREAGEG